MSTQITETLDDASDIRLLTNEEADEVNGALIWGAIACIVAGIELGIMWVAAEKGASGGNVDFPKWLGSTPPIL